MRILTLLRHADAEDPYGTSDRDRPLSGRGEEQARHLGRWCSEQPVPPDLWLVSDALRARQTVQGILATCAAAADRVRSEADLYLAGAAGILELLRRAPSEARHVCVVGHNPGLSVLASQLCRRSSPSLGTACLVTMPLGLADWSGLAPGCAETCEGWSA